MNEIIIGSDPEIFVEDETGNNIPAFNFLPSKYEPLKTVEEGLSYYWDGFQTEFNITPSSNLDTCLTSIRYGLSAILTAARKKCANAQLSTKTVITVPEAALKLLPAEFTDFGCMPSYNVYDLSGNIGEGQTVPYRFAGGHIHFGIGPQSYEMIGAIVRGLDAVLGIACVSLFEHFDNPVRRQYYGLPGEFRVPPHGLEYRVLSDAWLFSPETARAVLDMSRKVVHAVMTNTLNWKADKGEVIETILKSNATMARSILEHNSEALSKFKCLLDFTKPIKTINNISNNWSI